MIGALFYLTGATVWTLAMIGTAVFAVAVVRIAFQCVGFVWRCHRVSAAWRKMSWRDVIGQWARALWWAMWTASDGLEIRTESGSWKFVPIYPENEVECEECWPG